MGVISRPSVVALALVLALLGAQGSYYDPGHPSDIPLNRCTVNMDYDPLNPEISMNASVIMPPSTQWLEDEKTRPWYYSRLGYNAYRAGRLAEALRNYQHAAALSLASLGEQPNNYQLDELLTTGQSLYRLGDRRTAGKLWLAYLHRATAPDYVPMAHALKQGRYRAFFSMMLKDSASFTQRNPIDLESGGLQWIVAGAEAGARGNYAKAQTDFRESIRCGLWDPAYAVFAWGATRYALGGMKDAHHAWFEAVAEGDSSAQMPFDNNANAASVTMLLYLPI